MTSVAAVIPAAGRARRMGGAKLLLPFGEDTVVGATTDALRRGGAERLVLVLAPDAEELRGWADAEGLESVVNPDPDRGMLSSVQEGLRALGTVEALLVCPADLPLLRAETVRSLLEAACSSPASLAVPRYGARRGHPLWIASSLQPAIHHLHPEIGLRQLLLEPRGEILEVEVDDPGILRDLDTLEDYRRLTEAVPHSTREQRGPAKPVRDRRRGASEQKP